MTTNHAAAPKATQELQDKTEAKPNRFDRAGSYRDKPPTQQEWMERARREHVTLSMSLHMLRLDEARLREAVAREPAAFTELMQDAAAAKEHYEHGLEVFGAAVARLVLTLSDFIGEPIPEQETDEAEDPHVGWAQEVAKIRAMDGQDETDEEVEERVQALWDLHRKAAETPARTLAGIQAQIAVAIDCCEGGTHPEENELAALRSALASLEAMSAPISAKAA